MSTFKTIFISLTLFSLCIVLHSSFKKKLNIKKKKKNFSSPCSNPVELIKYHSVFIDKTMEAQRSQVI